MKTKNTFPILIFSILFSSCSKDKGCGGKLVEYANMPQLYKDIVPYKGGEKLTFLHVNTGDTLTFVGESNWTSYTNSTFSGADCVIETKREGRGIAYLNNNLNKKIVINQRNTNSYVATFEVDFEKEYFITTSGDFSSGRSKFDYDSLIIAGKKYYKVFKFNIDATYNPPTDFFIYCNSEYGILKFELKTGETWELINKQ